MENIKDNAKDLAVILRVLSNENRLLILCELIKAECTVNQLIDKLNITQSGISQHLNILKAYGILESNKVAQNVFYRIKDKKVINIFKVLKENYCCKE